MKNNILSEMAQKITPYQWAKNVGPKVLRFDTNTLPESSAVHVKNFLNELINNCPLMNTGIPRM